MKEYMEARKCYRCGKLFERRCLPDVVVTMYMHGYGEMRLDFCKECHLDLIRFCRFTNRDYLIESADVSYGGD